MTPDQPRVRGEAADGMVVLELGADGDLEVTLDPRVRRLDTDDLAAAIQNAFRDLRTRASALGEDDRAREQRRAAASEALAPARDRLDAAAARASELRRRIHGQRA
ncbi:YbaB/EbfC family nucleoid-associated protein [Nocardioides litoris]|uniref:YbaB/EbfC family nucleoid-associated protein n=1 Tax=Nocardioides litoris TaxID=1926648 RepID=UPI001121A855|nr:YbaB/EbfC family nucleoid-associated protein [Nocardioides litoris]